MKKLNTMEPGRLEEIAVISFFIIFFLFTVVAESFGQVNGNSGHCREFNGTTSGISFVKSDPGLSTVSAMTVTAWVKCISSSASGSWAGICSIDDSSSNGDLGQFWLQHSTSNTQFEFALENASSNRVYVQSVTTPTDGVWYHVAGVYDGSFIYIYVNGVMEARTAQTGKINSFQSTFKMVFGRWAYSGNAYRRLDGDIDEVTLWNVALTQSQIRTNMCKKLVGTEAGLIGYWRMNETSGTTLNDQTSNARAGKAANTTIVWSGAPIGDASTFTYGSGNLSINQPTNKDSMTVNFGTTPTGVQMYRIDTTENYTVAPTGYLTMVTTYYYGVFICDQNGETFKMTYYYSGNPSVTNASQTGIAYRSDNSVLSWADLGASLNLPQKYFQKSALKSRAEYAVVLKTIVLPVHMLSFDAQQDNNSVTLNWATATEVNNDHFTIERTTDGINYETITSVKGAGNSDFELNYSAVDANPVAGTSYYKLVQTDYDGKSQTYGPVAVTFTPKVSNSFEVQSVYPTVFSTDIKINFTCQTATDLNMELVSMNGQVVKQGIIHTSEGTNLYSLNQPGLTSGMYILNLYDSNGNHKVSEKIIKQ